MSSLKGCSEISKKYLGVNVLVIFLYYLWTFKNSRAKSYGKTTKCIINKIKIIQILIVLHNLKHMNYLFCFWQLIKKSWNLVVLFLSKKSVSITLSKCKLKKIWLFCVCQKLNISENTSSKLLKFLEKLRNFLWVVLVNFIGSVPSNLYIVQKQFFPIRKIVNESRRNEQLNIFVGILIR